MIDRFLGDALEFFLPVLECCSTVWCLNYLKLLDCVVSGASFLTVGMFDCDIAPRRSVAVLCKVCMLYKIRCNPMHILYSALSGPLFGALPVTYVAVRVISQYRNTFIRCCGTSRQEQGQSFFIGLS